MQGNCSLNDTRIRNFDRFLLKMPEHTWGLPSAQDNVHWSNAQFHPLRTVNSNFIQCANAWYEQRQFADYALTALQDHPLASSIRERLPDLVVNDLPDLSKYNEYTSENDMSQTFTCGNFEIAFDGITGNIVTFIRNNNGTKYEYASVDSPLGQIIYTSFDETDFDYMMQWYGGNAGYSKSGSQNATIRQHWYPTMLAVYSRNDTSCSLVTHLSFADSKAHTLIGAPSDIFVNLTLDPFNNDHLFVEYLHYNKTITRLPEQMMFGFSPIDEASTKNGGNGLPTFYVEKMNSMIKFSEVRINGSQYQHGIWEYVKAEMIKNSNIGDFITRSLDTGLVAPITTQTSYDGWFGTPTCFPVPLYQLTDVVTDITGFAFNLYNNLWDTNYATWYPYMDSWPLLNSNDANAKFRFEISIA